MRLTDHLEKDSVFTCDEKTFIKCYKKLSQLEDIFQNHNIKTLEELNGLLWYVKQIKNIEKELDIDLITLFKALKNGIWVKYDADFGFTGKPKIVIEKDKCTEICLREKKWWIQENDFLLEDYGETWALTKEELE